MATLAPSLVALRNEINERFPGRDRSSDGWIGDAAHAARPSDHNPGARGYVHALDIDEDIDGVDDETGAELMWLAEHLRTKRDPRVKYVIYEGRIFSSYATAHRRAWEWGPYTGVNAHRRHLHVSILSTPAAEQDTSPWLPPLRQAPAPAASRPSTLDPREVGMLLVPLEGNPGHALVGPGYWRNLGQSEIDALKAAGVPVGKAVPRDKWDRIKTACTEGRIAKPELQFPDPHAILTWYAAVPGGDTPLHKVIREVVRAEIRGALRDAVAELGGGK